MRAQGQLMACMSNLNYNLNFRINKIALDIEDTDKHGNFYSSKTARM